MRGIELIKSIALAVPFILIVGLMQERDERAALSEYKQFVHDNCQPKYPLDRAVAVLDEQARLTCAIFANAAYGRNARLIKTASMEIPHALRTAPR